MLNMWKKFQNFQTKSFKISSFFNWKISWKFSNWKANSKIFSKIFLICQKMLNFWKNFQNFQKKNFQKKNFKIFKKEFKLFNNKKSTIILADKFEAIVENQTALEQRIVKVLVNLSNGEMSEIEKSAAKEVRETGRQLTKIEKSIDRVKILAGDIEPLKVKICQFFDKFLKISLKKVPEKIWRFSWNG